MARTVAIYKTILNVYILNRYKKCVQNLQ